MKLVPRSSATVALIGLIGTTAIWGSNNVVSKIVLQEVSPVLLALTRFTLAGLLFYLPAFLLLHRGDQRFESRDWPRLLILGTVGVAGSMVMHLLGLLTTPANDAGIYSLTTPLFVLIIGCLLFGERLTAARLGGIAAAFLGALVLVVGEMTGFGGGDLQGAAMLLSSALVWAGYTVFSRALLARRSPLLVVATVNLVALVAIWPIAGIMGVWSEIPSIVQWSPRTWVVMIYLVVVMSTLTQWLYVRSIRDLQPSQVSAVLYSKPLFTAISAAVLISELPSLTTYIAGALLLLGVWLVNRPTGRRARPAPAPRVAEISPGPAQSR